MLILAHSLSYTLYPPFTSLKLDSKSDIWNTPGNKFLDPPLTEAPKV